MTPPPGASGSTGPTTAAHGGVRTGSPARAQAPAPTGSPTTSIRIREADQHDLAAIQEVVEAAYRGDGGWTTESHLVRGDRSSRREIGAMLADETVLLLVATTPAGVVGCCYTRLEGRRAELGLFAVHPSAQSGGIGSRLLRTQAERRRAGGAHELMIQVLQARPELHAWYRRQGFRATGRERPFPGDPSQLAEPGLRMVEMVRPLSQL